MEYVLVIPGKLHNLNDYIYAERTNRYVGSQMKKSGSRVDYPVCEATIKRDKNREACVYGIHLV